jgi:hypothetical protein
MNVDQISARSIDFNPTRDTDKMEADDLIVAVSILNFRMNEMVIKNHMTEFQENVEQISELSRQKNKWTAQMNAMSDEQKAAGLYVDDEGNLKSVLDSKSAKDIELPDPEKLAADPVESTWNAKIKTENGEILDITISYEIGYENGQYYFQITEFKVGDFLYSKPTEYYNYSMSFGFTLPSDEEDGDDDDFDDKIYINGTQSLNEILNDVFDKILEKIEQEYGEITPSAGETYRDPIKSALATHQSEIIGKFVQDIFKTMESSGYTSESFDAIFTQNGGESSTTTGVENGHTVMNLPFKDWRLQLDIYWEYDSATQAYNFSVYISIPGLTTATYANLWSVDGYDGNLQGLLNVANANEQKANKDETESQFLTRVFKKLIDDVRKKLYDYAAQGIGLGSDAQKEATYFWKVLFGSELELTHDDMNHNLLPQRKVDKIFLSDPDQEIELIGGKFDREHLEGFAQDVYDTLNADVVNAVNQKTVPNFDFSLANTPESGEATDGTSAVVGGFYAPNFTPPNQPSDNPQAFLEKIMGPEIYTNGLAYSDVYWRDQLIPQMTDVITDLGSANEILMSKIKRSIETANAYLQMIITNLQKQYQSLNSVSNNM